MDRADIFLYSKTARRKLPSRNSPCPCMSGRKFKKCCLPKIEMARDKQLTEARDEHVSRNQENIPK